MYGRQAEEFGAGAIANMVKRSFKESQLTRSKFQQKHRLVLRTYYREPKWWISNLEEASLFYLMVSRFVEVGASIVMRIVCRGNLICMKKIRYANLPRVTYACLGQNIF